MTVDSEIFMPKSKAPKMDDLDYSKCLWLTWASSAANSYYIISSGVTHSANYRAFEWKWLNINIFSYFPDKYWLRVNHILATLLQ